MHPKNLGDAKLPSVINHVLIEVYLWKIFRCLLWVLKQVVGRRPLIEDAMIARFLNELNPSFLHNPCRLEQGMLFFESSTIKSAIAEPDSGHNDLVVAKNFFQSYCSCVLFPRVGQEIVNDSASFPSCAVSRKTDLLETKRRSCYRDPTIRKFLIEIAAPNLFSFPMFHLLPGGKFRTEICVLMFMWRRVTIAEQSACKLDRHHGSALVLDFALKFGRYCVLH